MRSLDETPVVLTTERLELLLGGARILGTLGLPAMAQNVVDSMREEVWLEWTRQGQPSDDDVDTQLGGALRRER